ncbi:MAG TPA: nuclear transport factor 2 family protein [Halococcus sp.]|nr:nuclear transport factor 2 family protein [Halococcus sp.]
MNAEATIETYYDALREGEPLHPFFAADAMVKFGISERLTGYEEIEAGLREQTRTTDEWTIESSRLNVTERDGFAWFSDDVRMAWTGEDGERHDHETRWSGVLHRQDDWKFIGMHVSVPSEP